MTALGTGQSSAVRHFTCLGASVKIAHCAILPVSGIGQSGNVFPFCLADEIGAVNLMLTTESGTKGEERGP